MKIEIIPVKIRREVRDKKIRALFRAGYTMEAICKMEGHSKTTVFFAIKGRSKVKKSVEKN